MQIDSRNEAEGRNLPMNRGYAETNVFSYFWFNGFIITPAVPQQ
jgi:hypothetical protein